MPDDELNAATNILVTVLAVVLALVLAFVLATVIAGVVRRVGRRSTLVSDISHRMRRPLRGLLMVVAVWTAVRIVTDPAVSWLPAVEHLMVILFIGVGAWFIGALAFVAEDSVLKRFRTDVADNRHARRVRTQISVLRRLTVALVVVLALAGVLLTFPQARAAGASLLASAGVISIVAGLAAQTSLANIFAGMQVAFTDAIRVGDVVVLEGEWGRIEEITMTYVVVHLWDDRRLIMPCTYFTTTPFQNWTRRSAELLGTVEIDLDWDVPLAPMRAELKRLLEASTLWDKRVGILQVTDATGGFVRVRAMASAADAGTLFDLRCYVREGLVDWLHRAAPQGVPRTRLLRGAPDIEMLLGEPGVDGALAGAGAATGAAAGAAAAATPSKTPSRAAAPSLPQRIPARTRPGLRMHLSEPGRGIFPEPHEDETVILPVVRASEETQVFAPVEGLFSGSSEAEERSRAFSGPGQDVIDERERTAQMDRIVDDEPPAHPRVTGDTPDGEGP
ncbi:Small-conductance mechanosensitive channel [Sanguibacter gelidistatuariae]|uniref:Small-conductance mechanosensitive channel n=1 Tax=Sanguibacter gelidistatuariae TaxID=1814289 RepID=A0A1G6HHN6_9MICO|nr:mechanosensitive ion channel domain-containing protein [Sanguibacter gelidistatuariae]SDB93752.1 Small-conductance mechanosensitive channel [Sanguibacter gelidistatuariae]